MSAMAEFRKFKNKGPVLTGPLFLCRSRHEEREGVVDGRSDLMWGDQLHPAWNACEAGYAEWFSGRGACCRVPGCGVPTAGKSRRGG